MGSGLHGLKKVIVAVGNLLAIPPLVEL